MNRDVIEQLHGIKYENIFLSYKRNDDIKNIVLHETGGISSTGAINSMKKQKLGVHFIISPNGEIIPCVDPLLMTCHAKGMNNKSVGIEVVNPYSPNKIKTDHNYSYIEAQWWTWCPDKNDKRYVLPFPGQIHSAIKLVDYLCDEYGVKFVFPTEKIRKKLDPAIIGPGVVAHRDFGQHSDGRYILEKIISNARMRSIGVKEAVY